SGDRAGAHDPLEFVAGQARDLLHRLLKRYLYLGQRWNWHPYRQVIIQHVVLAHIGVSQYIVSQRLRVSQASAMAEHYPGMGPQHGDVVRDRLGVGGSYADIDHGYAPMVRLFQMIGGHLGQAGQRHAFGGRRLSRARDDIARLDEFAITLAAIRHLLTRERTELVYIELVIGEEHEILEVLRAGGCVMRKPVQRVVDPLGREHGQGPRLAEPQFQRSIGNVIVRAVQIRYVEQIADRDRKSAASGKRVDTGELNDGS